MRFHPHSMIFDYVQRQSTETITRTIKVNTYGTMKGIFRISNFMCFRCGETFFMTDCETIYWVKA